MYLYNVDKYGTVIACYWLKPDASTSVGPLSYKLNFNSIVPFFNQQFYVQPRLKTAPYEARSQEKYLRELACKRSN